MCLAACASWFHCGVVRRTTSLQTEVALAEEEKRRIGEQVDAASEAMQREVPLERAVLYSCLPHLTMGASSRLRQRRMPCDSKNTCRATSSGTRDPRASNTQRWT